MAKIRVAIVDDEGLLRSGLQLMIDAAEDLQVVCSCTGADALRLLPQANADVVLLDIQMPEVDGLTVLRALRATPPPAAGRGPGGRAVPAVAMLTTFAADDLIAEALRAGADGYLLKDTDPGELVAAIRALAAGRPMLSPAVARTVIDGYLEGADDPEALQRLMRLSPREREILAMLADGSSNAVIGERLYLSASTVKDYVSAILAKLGVTNRVQAAVLAHRAGLTDV
ncbi:response regulator transcription factor [Kribbella sp. NPDC051718]|uniref:response regulator transcription factor n=1 Tax=Kribbella sp. NPDC051718 TaxID=3155168 RepID=UPI00342BE382